MARASEFQDWSRLLFCHCPLPFQNYKMVITSVAGVPLHLNFWMHLISNNMLTKEYFSIVDRLLLTTKIHLQVEFNIAYNIHSNTDYSVTSTLQCPIQFYHIYPNAVQPYTRFWPGLVWFQTMPRLFPFTYSKSLYSFDWCTCSSYRNNLASLAC